MNILKEIIINGVFIGVALLMLMSDEQVISGIGLLIFWLVITMNAIAALIAASFDPHDFEGPRHQQGLSMIRSRFWLVTTPIFRLAIAVLLAGSGHVVTAFTFLVVSMAMYLIFIGHAEKLEGKA